MAHFGIELIAKKDGYPSQNDFALSASMARFRHRRFNAKRMVRSENDFGLRVAQERVGFLDGPSYTLRIIGRNEPLLYLRVSIVYMDRSMRRFLHRSCIF